MEQGRNLPGESSAAWSDARVDGVTRLVAMGKVGLIQGFLDLFRRSPPLADAYLKGNTRKAKDGSKSNKKRGK